jgi:nucleotide-binding universal stress UspA family protein
MYDSILIPFDGSDEAMKGARHGIGLAETCGATVHALYVIDLPGAPRTVYLRDDEDEMRERYRKYGEEVTAEVEEMAAERGLDCVTALRSGSPGEEIVDYAKDEEIGAIVLGSAYRGKLGALLGSTAEKVVRTAETPVVTVREQVND